MFARLLPCQMLSSFAHHRFHFLSHFISELLVVVFFAVTRAGRLLSPIPFQRIIFHFSNIVCFTPTSLRLLHCLLSTAWSSLHFSSRYPVVCLTVFSLACYSVSRFPNRKSKFFPSLYKIYLMVCLLFWLVQVSLILYHFIFLTP